MYILLVNMYNLSIYSFYPHSSLMTLYSSAFYLPIIYFIVCTVFYVPVCRNQSPLVGLKKLSISVIKDMLGGFLMFS